MTSKYKRRRQTDKDKREFLCTDKMSSEEVNLLTTGRGDMEKGRLTFWLVFSALISSIGSCFIFGYSIGAMNAPEKIIGAWINESHKHLFHEEMTYHGYRVVITLAVSILLVGGTIGSFCSGFFANKYGRKTSILMNNTLLVFALIFLGCAKKLNVYHILIIGRFIMGLHNGLSTGLLPMYLTEISPKNFRGAFGSLAQMSVVFGVLVAQVLGHNKIMGTERLWPTLLCLPAIPCLVQIIFLPFCPESPKHLLVNKGDNAGAHKALKYLRGTEDVKDELEHLQHDAERLAQMEKVKFIDLVSDKYLWPFIISIVMMFSQQLGGINAVLFYSTSIFENAGLSQSASQFATMGVGGVQVVVTLISIFLIDIGGRRLLQLLGLIFQLLTCLGLYAMLNVTEKSSEESWASIVAIIFSISFVAAFCLGPGSIPWFFVSELFESNARGHANSVGCMLNWAASFAVTLGYPLISDEIHQHSFLIFIGFLIIFILFTLKFVPETKGLRIEEIVRKFENPNWKAWPVWES